VAPEETDKMAFELGILGAWLLGMISLATLVEQCEAIIKRERRFSLADLLLVFTLVAAISGVMVGIAHLARQ
jgi:hypothetical protein